MDFDQFVCFCVLRFVVCVRNYDWRQQKPQLGRRLLKFRVLVFLKSTVKDDPENLEFACSFFISYPFNRNVFSRRRQITRGCVFTGVGTSASITATAVVGDGISPLMAQSVRPQQLLMRQSI